MTGGTPASTESSTAAPAPTDAAATTPAAPSTTPGAATPAPVTAEGTPALAPPTVVPPPAADAATAGSTTPGVPPAAQTTPTPIPQPRQPWELVEEILNILKTAFPLLALSMEKMVDQINSRGKPPQEEDIYRFLSALLLDGTQVRPSLAPPRLAPTDLRH